MRKFGLAFPLSLSVLLVLFFLSPLTAFAQAAFTISPRQCVWHEGDDPAWAASNLDESGWQSLVGGLPYRAHVWLRCHIQFDGLRNLEHPAISVTAYSAYQEFFQGQLIAEVGNMGTGDYSRNIVHIQALPLPLPAARNGVIALRMVNLPEGFEDLTAFALAAGDAPELNALRAQTIVENVKPRLLYVTLYSIVGVVGIVQLGLFFYDRTRRDLLWLSIYCIVVAILRVNALAAAALVHYSNFLHNLIYLLGNFGFLLQTIFFFSLARKRIPRSIWVLYVISQAEDFLLFAQVFVSPVLKQRLDSVSHEVSIVGLSAWTLMTLTPFVAFWPWNRISSRLRPVALCCMLWGLCDFVYFLAQTIMVPFLNLELLYSKYALVLYDVRAVVSGATVLLILVLLFRDQRQITEERAALAGEMASAREIQQYLIPEHLPPTPGLAIQSVYHPSREVGGDFFQVLPDARDGSTLIVVGDVAGKGLQAGMLAALIVGAIRTAFKFTSAPSEILALLNERLQGRGLVTCLALRIHPNGAAELANAGHLPPYVNGKELAVEGALPLGAAPGIVFPTMRFQIAAGEAMLLISDGVVEARNSSGELFGFGRTAALSTEPAEKVAQAAQAFGQEDDITVLTLALTA
jgi:hypothetical protein